MEDHNKVKKIIHIVIGVIIAIIIIIIVGLIYNKIMVNKNTNDFYDYLLKNGYKDNNDGTFTKNSNTENKTINYLFTESNFVLSKEIVTNDNNATTNILMTYNSDGTIEISLDLTGLNENGDYGNTLQTGTYNTKNDDFNCKILIDKGMGSNCKNMLSEVKIFSKEVTDLLNHSKTKAKYIK